MLSLLVFGPMAASAAVYGIGKVNKTFRNAAAAAVTIFEVLLFIAAGLKVISGETVVSVIPGICSVGMHFKMDGFRLLYGFIAAFMWCMTTIFSPEYFAHYRNRNRYYFFILMTLGATVGVFLSDDLLTTFICFEIMSFTSYVWVAQEEKKEALKAAETYLCVAVIGGMVMLIGLFMLYHAYGTLGFLELHKKVSESGVDAKLFAAGTCLLFGFGAKAGMFPLHIWLPKAHPVAPAPASALLSGILTKSGIFGILVVSCNLFRYNMLWGQLIFTLGIVTMFVGAFIAVFSVNLKRTLACSSMSQIGFILTGIGLMCILGEENALAVRGSVLHMVNHSMIKLILFMCAGVVYFNLHKLDLNEIRGFGRGRRLLTFCFAAGALSISGMPLFSGYVSKTLLHEGILEACGEISGMHDFFKTCEWIFLLTGGMTFAYMLKLFVCIFVEKGAGEKSNKVYMKPLTAFAIALPSLMLFIMGIMPDRFMNPLAHISLSFLSGEEPLHVIHYFSLENLKGAAVSLTIGACIYLVFIRKVLIRKNVYVNIWPSWLDLENLIYRPVIQYAFINICAFIFRCFDKVTDGIVALAAKYLLSEVKDGEKKSGEKWIVKTLGGILNLIRDIVNLVIFRKSPVTTDYVKELSLSARAAVNTQNIFSKSVSYGLMFFAAGLLVMVIYMLRVIIYKKL